MKKEKRYWYSKAGGLFHAVYPPVEGYYLTTLCQNKIKPPYRKVVGAIDGKWKEAEKQCGNCKRYLKI